MLKKGKAVLLVLVLFSIIPGVFALPFAFELLERYDGVHTENYPCWASMAIELGDVFTVEQAGVKAGYLTGVCSHTHAWSGGAALFVGSLQTNSWTVSGVCSKCGYNWFTNTFTASSTTSKLASTVRICGGDDNGGKQTWGGWGGYPYWFAYNPQSRIGQVGRNAEEVKLGRVSDFFEQFSGLKGQSGWKITVASKNPEVMVWVGGPGDLSQKETANVNADVWACADTDKNQQCDADQAVSCLGAGGDWYKGVCCGTQITSCGYVAAQDAICGKASAAQWEWAPKNESGEIHALLSCPGGSVVSDGSAFYSCGDQLSGATQPFGEFRSVTVDGRTHEYYCSAKNVYECGGLSPFSSVNSRLVGDTTVSTAAGCPAGIVGYWKFDSATAQDSVGGNDGAVEGAVFGPGPVGSVAVFDGSNDRIEIPDAPVLSPSSELTVEAWVYPSSTSGTRAILNKGNSYELVVQDGVLKGAIQRTTGGLWSLQGSGSVPAGSWSHVAMTYNGAVMGLYVNGILVNEFPMTGVISGTAYGLFIGDKSDAVSLPGVPFHGSIDEVAVYDKALTPAQISSHAGTPASYCAAAAGADAYYCASDGDWTKDLDVKDVLSCDSAGFKGTGSLCCSEADDASEYYNDPLGAQPDLSSLIAMQSGAVINGSSIALSAPGSFVLFNGPARLFVDKWSEREVYAGVYENCKLSSSRVIEIPFGQQRYVVNSEPAPADPAGSACTLRNTLINFEAAPGRGGCWNKQFVESGQFAVPGKVINYRGRFYGCRVTDGAVLLLKDTHVSPPNDTLVDNSVETCGYVLNNAVPGGQFPHAVCKPGGVWEFTDELMGTIEKPIAWPLVGPGISQTGCCAFEQCWNGTKCQALGAYYRIGDQGFVCKL